VEGVAAQPGQMEVGPREVAAAAAAPQDRALQEAAEAEVLAQAGRQGPDASAAIRQAAERPIAPEQRDNVKGGSPDPAPPASDEFPDAGVRQDVVVDDVPGQETGSDARVDEPTPETQNTEDSTTA